MAENNYVEQFKSENEQDDDVQFHTVDDILAYYNDRHTSHTDKTEDTVN
ncbi:hypothetical protein SAMN05661091_1989 [Paenibacillus uliginis N3/975]|uniref:Uncharacterized protein n=1 Tax=Paenibacillus uliginis N3/975 TaxID=1313296 RepID=A0A1X7H986_9BACL|nr:hypothetical protein [Paenibacillus uliginis]SMF81418.1 hypothetical protein SAMN05661091_1989 [Paenibacillus uliginis N3/975]